ncbi:MAG TPA: bacterial proteasome activator family protein [Acidimicrobiales bacterium]|nr:bacterial proteasome activator family protein [Acidimicrobiales bacterium]
MSFLQTPENAEPPTAEPPEVVPPQLVADAERRPAGEEDGNARGESVEHPAKVMRIASMIRQLLDEVRQAPLDEASRNRLREIYETSIEELCSGLSPSLRDELSRVSLPFSEGATPSEAELRVAQAQLVGWLEGLFHGIQATMFAQQMAVKAEEEMRRRGLPPGPEDPRSGMRPPGYL